MSLIQLKDFSIQVFENEKLYKRLNEVNFIAFDSSICDVVGKNEEIKPILEIRKGDKEAQVIITTFGFVGRFSYFGLEFDITYRFGKTLLDRMIAKVNDFDIKSLEYEAKNTKQQSQNDSLAMIILYLNFIFKLEKLSILGIPKSYQRIEHRSDKFKGQLDINRYIKKDIPFQGKISSTSYEQVYVQDIVDVLYNALVVVENSMGKMVNERLFQTRNLIYHHSKKTLVNEQNIQNAIYHKSIQNSLYSDFKHILEIASYIIKYNNKLEYSANSVLSGLIFDVSLLWENYLYVLLRDSLESENWKVIHEEKLEVYNQIFYARNMYPDIVIKNENEKKVIVFDAKSKSMQFRDKYHGADVDRNDFFQINTYMSYYHNQGLYVKAGGLLYPIEVKFDSQKCYSNNWLGNSNTKFIIDGIDLSNKDSLTMADILKSENTFVERIQKLIEKETSVLQSI